MLTLAQAMSIFYRIIPSECFQKGITIWLPQNLKSFGSKPQFETEYCNRNNKFSLLISFFCGIFFLIKLNSLYRLNRSSYSFRGESRIGMILVTPEPLQIGVCNRLKEGQLTAPIEPVRLSDLKTLGPLAFKPKHTCKQDDLQN